jgi:hypothetical protein
MCFFVSTKNSQVVPYEHDCKELNDKQSHFHTIFSVKRSSEVIPLDSPTARAILSSKGNNSNTSILDRVERSSKINDVCLGSYLPATGSLRRISGMPLDSTYSIAILSSKRSFSNRTLNPKFDISAYQPDVSGPDCILIEHSSNKSLISLQVSSLCNECSSKKSSKLHLSDRYVHIR